jgi:dipeptidyl aminopeptidase/acylaminoacyl peptidase
MATRRKSWGFLIGVVAALAFASTGRSKAKMTQAVKPLPVEAVLNMRTFGEWVPMAISPSGHWLAYVTRDSRRVQSMDLEAYRQTGVPFWGTGADIWVANLRTGETRNITKGVGDNWLPVWSPESDQLAFLSDRDGSGHARLWLFDVETDRISELSQIDVSSNEIEWIPTGRSLLVTVIPEGTSHVQSAVSPVRRVMKQYESESGVSPIVYKSPDLSGTHRTGGKSDPWNLNDNLAALVAVDVESGRTNMMVRHQRISWYTVSPDGHYVAYTVPLRFEEPGSQQIIFSLNVVDLKTAQNHVLASQIRLDYDGVAFSWSPDSQRIAFHTGGMNERNYDCYVIGTGIAGATPRNVSHLPALHNHASRKSDAPLWDRNGHEIYFLREGAIWRANELGNTAEKVGTIADRDVIQIISSTPNMTWSPSGTHSIVLLTHDGNNKQDGVYELNVANGQSSVLLEKGECYTCVESFRHFVVAADKLRVLYLAEDAQHDDSLRMTDYTFHKDVQLVSLNQQLDQFKTGAARLIRWMDDDGEELNGALLLPADFKEGTRYPLIVWVYGGSFLSNDLDHFGLISRGPFNMQLFATRGYAVLLPDAPLHAGTPMLDLAKTVLPGVNKVIEMGIADPDRLGVIGHSYGGYSTLALIVQTNRFKAAIEVSGFGSLFGLYGEMDKSGDTFGIPVVESGQGLMGGTPWQSHLEYVQNSPLFDLDRVQTPLLVVQGEKDKFVQSFLADELFVDLRRLGKEVEYAKYSGEGHSPPYWSQANQMDFCTRMLAWFDARLGISRLSDAKAVSPNTYGSPK